MTKYVLNSGGLAKHPERAEAFYAEVTKDLTANPRILLCYFAQPREYWEQKFVAEKVSIPEQFPAGYKPVLELAFPDTFAEQISRADVVYLRGGDDHLLQYWLRKFDLPTLWKGKVIVGSSAGSNALVTHAWTCDWRQCIDGLGILPIKFIPHYNSDWGEHDPQGPIDWARAKQELQAYKNTSLPIYAPEEGEFVVFHHS